MPVPCGIVDDVPVPYMYTVAFYDNYYTFYVAKGEVVHLMNGRMKIDNSSFFVRVKRGRHHGVAIEIPWALHRLCG